MIRELFSRRPQPYYIYAPDYRRNSAGIRVLHMLCDALNRSGQEAYVMSSGVNPALMTPHLNPDIVALHRAHGLEPILVYPEVVEGNPFGATVVARYLLNKPGHLAGDGVYPKTDLLFAYMRGLLQPGMPEENVLHCPAIDLSIFRPPADPAKRVAGKVCYYQGRSGQATLDPALLPTDAVEITPHFPDSWEGLADLFQQCEYLYLGERSGLAAEAALCGCVSIVIPGKWAPEPLSLSENNSYGTAWGNTPEAIERARSTLHLIRERQLEHQVTFWASLDRFIELTQDAAQREARGNRLRKLTWLRERHPDPQQLALMQQRLLAHTAPTFGVLILDRGHDAALLKRTRDSLDRTLYTHIRTFVLGAEPVDDPGITWLACELSDPVGVINGLAAQTDCDWLLLVEAGIEFTASGLLMSALALLEASSECVAVYADEAIRVDGVVDLALRPDLNLDLLLSFPASLSRHWLFRRDALVQAGGFSGGTGPAFEFEYQLRLLEQQGFASIGHVSEPLLIGDSLPLRDCAHERDVILKHLHRRGYEQAEVLALAHAPGRYRVDYGHATQPAVSIVVALQGNLVQFQRCIESLLGTTRYAHYEVLLLDPGSQEAAVSDWLNLVGQLGDGTLRVLGFTPGTSLAAMCNEAARQARGDYLLWLGAGAGVFDAQWLPSLLNHAQRPEVGAVGGKLVSADGTIRQAGLVLGLGGTVGGAFQGLHHQAMGTMARLQVDQNYSALSMECLMVSRESFFQVGGFDESLTPWIDVDLCLKLAQSGRLNVWTPHAQLLMDGPGVSATADQEDALYARWLPLLARDPAYNPGLSLSAGNGFALAGNDLAWHPMAQWRPLPTVLAVAADQKRAGHARIIHPWRALREATLVDGPAVMGLPSPVELERYAPDTVILQRPLDDLSLQGMRRLRAFSKAFKVYDVDGYLPQMDLPAAGKGWTTDEILQRLRYGLTQADRILVATPALAELLNHEHDDVRVLESGLPVAWANLESKRAVGGKPRVGMVATVDLAQLVDVIPALFHEVEWVLLGECPPALRPYVHALYPAVDEHQLPAALAGMNLDLALVPMADSLLNACSGDLRVLQHAACGHPVICSRVAGLAGGEVLPLTRVQNRPEEWIKAILLHLGDTDASGNLGQVLQSEVRRGWLLEGQRLRAWREAWLAD